MWGLGEIICPAGDMCGDMLWLGELVPCGDMVWGGRLMDPGLKGLSSFPWGCLGEAP